MPGLFGFPSMIERQAYAQPPGQGPGAQMVQGVLAGKQAWRDSGARQGLQQQAIERLSGIGTPEAQQVAELIAQNPRAAQQMVEQFGGFAKFEQQERQKATYNQAVQAAMQPGASPQDILAATLGGDPQTGMTMAGLSAQMQPRTPQRLRPFDEIVRDPQSPTGWAAVYLDPNDGMTEIGRQRGVAPPTNETTEVYGNDGNLLVRMGAGPGNIPTGPTPTKATQSKIQGDLTTAGDALDRLGDITRSFDKDFLTYESRLKALGIDTWEKLGGELSPEQQDFADDYFDFQAETIGHLNLTLKELSGAAVNEHEMERLKKELPTMEDGPSQFKAKLGRATRRINQFRDRRLHMLAFGMSDVSDYSLRQYKQDREQAIGGFAAKAKAENPQLTPEEAEAIGVERYLDMIEGAG